MSNDDLLLIGGLDQSLPVDNDTVLQRVEEIVEQSIIEKDALIALDACSKLKKAAKLAGLGLAKAFYLIKKNWKLYEREDDFDEIVVSETGFHAHTVERYVRVWDMLTNVAPTEHVSQLQQRNIKDLIPIANAVSEGYEIEDDEWTELVHAADYNTVSRQIRDITGKPPRKYGLQIMMDKNGQLTTLQDNQIEVIGWLNVDCGELGMKAINRIIKNGGILT
jgi:hypothetical protein